MFRLRPSEITQSFSPRPDSNIWRRVSTCRSDISWSPKRIRMKILLGFVLTQEQVVSAECRAFIAINFAFLQPLFLQLDSLDSLGLCCGVENRKFKISNRINSNLAFLWYEIEKGPRINLVNISSLAEYPS